MRTKFTFVLALLLLAGTALIIPPPQVLSNSDKTKPGRRVTLVNSWGSKKGDAFKSTLIFRPTALYNRETGPNREWDLRYGGLSFNNNRDWFILDCAGKGPNGGRHWNRIRDLGKLDWSDEIEVPVLPILPCRSFEQCGRILIPSRTWGKKIEDEDVNPHIARITVGHMYAVHISEGERDLSNRSHLFHQVDYYALVRVEELKPNESVTITWKRVPEPKK